MRGDRLKEILGEVRGLIERAQASLDDRPVLQRLLTELREKIRTVEDDKPEGEVEEDEAEDKKE